MPTNRFQFSDDFVLNTNKVGINSAIPQEKLDVVGIVKGDNLKVTGVSSFTSYEGFLNSNHNITENITLTSGTSGSLSGEIIVGTGLTLSGISSTTSGQGHIDSLKVYNTLTIPVGGTLERPSKAKPGQLYYNKDFSTIEFYDGDRWRQVDNTTQSGKMLFGPGNSGATTSTIDTINAHSLGNATYFGELSSPRATYGGGGGNSIRGLFGGGYYYSNVIDYVTIQSEGNAIDFGDLQKPNFGTSNSSSSTRAVFYRGYTNTPAVAVDTGIDYVEISTTGNALDFGTNDHTGWSSTGFASPTRGIHAGQYGPSGNFSLIKFITIASKGNVVYFGDAGISQGQSAGCSNSVRGIYSGGYVTEKKIMSIIISSTGTGFKFGDLSFGRQGMGSASTQTRGIFAGGNTPTTINVIDFVNITTGGDAIDFGDLTTVKRNTAACSDSHGGLGGF